MKKKATCKEVVPFNNMKKNGDDDDEDASTVSIPSTQNNYMQLMKQNPVGMFVGANLSSCTININIPK